MSKLFILLAIFCLFSCNRGTYLVERSANLDYPAYSKSFGLLQNQKENDVEEKLMKIVRKQLIKSKWIYDTENPDYIVTINYEDINGNIVINILDSQNFKCVWQGRVFDMPKSSNDHQLDRVIWVAFGR